MRDDILAEAHYLKKESFRHYQTLYDILRRATTFYDITTINPTSYDIAELNPTTVTTFTIMTFR